MSGGVHMYLGGGRVLKTLAGAMRVNWHGFEGGTEVRQIMSDLLADLRRRARVPSPDLGG